MDTNSLIATLIGSSAIILGALAKLNHKRLRSKCCGEEKEISVDIEDTTPKKSEPLEKVLESK
jgi:predicted RNA-binding protein Jag